VNLCSVLYCPWWAQALYRPERWSVPCLVYPCWGLYQRQQERHRCRAYPARALACLG